MYIKLITLIIFFVSNSAHSQTYLATYHADVKTTTGPPVSGKNSLYFTIDTAIYIHDEYPKESSFTVDGTIVTSVLGDKNGKPIITLRREDTQRYKEEYQAKKSMFIFEESISKIDWTISNEETSKDGITIRRANGSYGGRHYEVWFSPDIPFPYGPHRLGGLPGLIVNAKSDDGLVNFTLTKFSKLDPEDRPENLFSLGEGIPISNEEFKNYTIKLLLKVESMSTAELTMTNEDPNANYTIEKSRWTIISDYKAKRDN